MLKWLSSLVILAVVCSPAWGATQLKKTVCPTGLNTCSDGSTGDYTSLEACMNGMETSAELGGNGNLVGSDKYLDVEISGTWASADTTVVTIHNYTTDATRYINIYTIGDARNNGNISAGYQLKTATNLANTINVAAPYVTIDGLRFDNNNTFGNNDVVQITNTPVTIKYCVVTASSTANAKQLIRQLGAYSNFIYRNVLFNNMSTGSGLNVQQVNDASVVVDNTVYNMSGSSAQGIFASNTATTVLKNNLVLNTKTCYTLGSGTTNSNNASSDLTGNVGYRAYSASNEFVSSVQGSLNLHLKGGATSIDAGVDLGSPYNIDINGVLVVGTWDIGADEYVATSTGRPVSTQFVIHGGRGSLNLR